MVWKNPEDVSEYLSVKEKEVFRESQAPWQNSIAPTADRAASVVIDLLFIWLSSNLITSSIRKNWNLARYMDYEWEAMFWMLIGVLIVYLFGVLYQSLSYSLFTKSIGGALFRIQVVDVYTRKNLSFLQAVQRSSMWWLSWLGLGFPFLEIFTHRHRRPWYERLSESVSLSTSGRFANAPGQNEKSLTQGLVLPFVFLFVFLGFTEIQDFYSEVKQNRVWSILMTSSYPQCEEVNEIWPYWQQDESKLETALSLFFTKIIDRDCLEKEIQSAFVREVDLETAYLAKAFLRDDKEIQKKYLNAVCEEAENSDACFLADRFDSKMHFDFYPDIPIYAYLWYIEKLAEQHEWSKIQAVLSEFPDSLLLAPYLSERRIQTQWWMSKKEVSRESLITIYDFLDRESQSRISGWFCYHESIENCSSANQICNRYIDDILEQDSITSTQALAYIRSKECSKDYNLAQVLQDIKARGSYGMTDLIEAKAEFLIGDKEKLQNYVFNESYDLKQRYEAAFSLMKQKELSLKDLNILEKFWILQEEQGEWYLLGKKMLKKFKAYGKRDKAIRLGKQMLRFHKEDMELQQLLVELHMNLNENMPVDRIPASNSKKRESKR